MKAIVAVDKNWNIGKGNQLLYKIPEDLKFFKETTTGHIVVMGSKTFESMSCRPLPNRINVIITRQPGKYKPYGVESYNIDDFRHVFKDEPQDDIFIIGGEQIYKEFYKEIDTIYVTKFYRGFNADKSFPNLEYDKNFQMTAILKDMIYDYCKLTITKWERVK